MKLTIAETWYLTALAREQNQAGCVGPAHDLLRKNAYPDVPRTGPGSLAFSYEAVPLTSLLLEDFADLQAIDDFLRPARLVVGAADPQAVSLVLDLYHLDVEVLLGTQAMRAGVRVDPEITDQQRA